MGEAVLIVPEGVCVATKAHLGAGDAWVFDRDSGGLDVDVDESPSAPAGTPRLAVDAEVGFGELRIGHDRQSDHGPPWRDEDWEFGEDEDRAGAPNVGCEGERARTR
jgi:hypothetical protein